MGRRDERSVRRVRVLESFRTPRATTNPYLVLLLRSLGDEADVATFSWRTALLGRYDVLHLHWPEVLVERRTTSRSLVSALLLGAVLVRCRLTGRAVVRTAHNVRPHESPARSSAAVLRLCDRWTTAWIRLNDTTPTPAGALAVTIPHGHYRDWYRARGVDPEPGRLLTFGLLRPYKGVEDLLAAFAAVEDPALVLRLAGRPTDPGIAEAVHAAAAADPRVSARLDHVPDDDLVDEVERAALVVLPYRDLHNSGALLLALSLDRPVLVPRNAVTDALAAEVGEAWVQRYDGALGPGHLAAAQDAVRGLAGRPDLSGREWPEIGRRHADLFHAVASRRRHGPAGTAPGAHA